MVALLFWEDEKKSSYCYLLDFRIFHSLHGNFGDMGQLPFLVASGNDTIELVSDYCTVWTNPLTAISSTRKTSKASLHFGFFTGFCTLYNFIFIASQQRVYLFIYFKEENLCTVLCDAKIIGWWLMKYTFVESGTK